MNDHHAPFEAAASSSTKPSDFVGSQRQFSAGGASLNGSSHHANAVCWKLELQIFEQVAVRMDSKTTAESLMNANSWMKCVELICELTALMAKGQPAVVGTTGCSSQSSQMPTTQSSQASSTRSSQAPSARSSQMTSALASATGTKRARDKPQTPAKRKQPPSSPAVVPVVPEEVQDLNSNLPAPSGPIDMLTRNLLVSHMLVRQDGQGTSEPGAVPSPSAAKASGVLSQCAEPRNSASPARSGMARRSSARAAPADTKCPDCPSKIATADHRQHHIAKGAFPCKFCTYSSDAERGTQRHEAIHKQGKFQGGSRRTQEENLTAKNENELTLHVEQQSFLSLFNSSSLRNRFGWLAWVGGGGIQCRTVRSPSRYQARAPKDSTIPRARDGTPFVHLAAENAGEYELDAAVSHPLSSQPTRKSARNRNAPERFSPHRLQEKMRKKGKDADPLVAVRNSRFASCPAVPGRSILKSTTQRENVLSQGAPKKVAFKEKRTRFYTRGRSLGRRSGEEDDEVGPVCSPDRDPRINKNGQAEVGTLPEENENGSALGVVDEGANNAGNDESPASTPRAGI